jgi:hypothetical protein
MKPIIPPHHRIAKLGHRPGGPAAADNECVKAAMAHEKGRAVRYILAAKSYRNLTTSGAGAE